MVKAAKKDRLVEHQTSYLYQLHFSIFPITVFRKYIFKKGRHLFKHASFINF